ncbi:CoA transferase [Nocardioides pacificus]
MSDSDALRAWATSGAMALTGRTGGPPLAAPGDPAGLMRSWLADLARTTRRRTGTAPRLPGTELLGERAAIAGLRRSAPWSCGHAFRCLPTGDGWLGLSLPRVDDLSLVPALVEEPVADGTPAAWEAVARWARELSSQEAAARVELLGLPGGAIPADPRTVDAPRPDHSAHRRRGPTHRRNHLRERPRVIDLTSLWAGPLCAHLLGLGGAEVVKVESSRRPDGARSGPSAFFDVLHHGHAAVALDLADPADLDRLRRLVAEADLVLEASRPRALRQLGLVAEEVVAAGTSWLSITARGRDSDAVGFGDDVAACAGLVAREKGAPLPCGDALADPLTGVRAAALASEVLLSDEARLVDVSMLDVAREAALAPGPGPHSVDRRDGGWWVSTESDSYPVTVPTARRPVGPAPALGADNGRCWR